MSTQLRQIVYTDSQDMLLLSSTIASHYYNFCTDGSTIARNYGYPLVILLNYYYLLINDKSAHCGW
jgi:hypothetical protein